MAVPSYLRNRPRDLVKHCLQKISLAKGADLSAISTANRGVFSMESFTDNETKRCTVKFVGKKNIPKGICHNWNLSHYLCKHIFFFFLLYFESITHGNVMSCHHNMSILSS